MRFPMCVFRRIVGALLAWDEKVKTMDWQWLSSTDCRFEASVYASRLLLATSMLLVGAVRISRKHPMSKQ